MTTLFWPRDFPEETVFLQVIRSNGGPGLPSWLTAVSLKDSACFSWVTLPHLSWPQALPCMPGSAPSSYFCTTCGLSCSNGVLFLLGAQRDNNRLNTGWAARVNRSDSSPDVSENPLPVKFQVTLTSVPQRWNFLPTSCRLWQGPCSKPLLPPVFCFALYWPTLRETQCVLVGEAGSHDSNTKLLFKN